MTTCHVLMAIDASGSMYKLADDVRGGFNQYLDDLDADTDTNYRVSVFLFNTGAWPLCDDAPLAEAPRLNELSYTPGGGTALLDAIGNLVNGTRTVGKDDKVLVVVNTDGEENSSREWAHADVVRLVADKKKDPRWGFVFLGAGPDAWQQGAALGYASGQTVNTGAGTRGTYSGLSYSTGKFSKGAFSAEDVVRTASAGSVEADREGAETDDGH